MKASQGRPAPSICSTNVPILNTPRKFSRFHGTCRWRHHLPARSSARQPRSMARCRLCASRAAARRIGRRSKASLSSSRRRRPPPRPPPLPLGRRMPRRARTPDSQTPSRPTTHTPEPRVGQALERRGGAALLQVPPLDGAKGCRPDGCLAPCGHLQGAAADRAPPPVPEARRGAKGAVCDRGARGGSDDAGAVHRVRRRFAARRAWSHAAARVAGGTGAARSRRFHGTVCVRHRGLEP